MSDVNCPYCNAEEDICHDDGQGYAEDEIHQQECSECGKTFVFTTSVIFCYDEAKADCLNGGKHDYKQTKTYPQEYAKMRCTVCGEEKEIEDKQ